MSGITPRTILHTIRRIGQRILVLFPWTRFYRIDKCIMDSHIGNHFGWFIVRDEQSIGELKYIGPNTMSLTYIYAVTWFREEDLRWEQDPDAWFDQKIVFRNKRYPDAIVSPVALAPKTNDSLHFGM